MSLEQDQFKIFVSRNMKYEMNIKRDYKERKRVQIIPFFISFPCLEMNVKNLLNFAVIRNYGTCTLLQNFEQICKFMIYGVST